MSEYIQHMKTKLLQVRIEPDKIIELKARADDLGMSVSEYVRYLFSLDTFGHDLNQAIQFHGDTLIALMKKAKSESLENFTTRMKKRKTREGQKLTK